MAQFTAGPAALVSPNSSVTFVWTTDDAFGGRVEIYRDPGATDLVKTIPSEDINGNPTVSSEQRVTTPVATPLEPDTNYFFLIVATDATGQLNDFRSETLPLATGAQALTEVVAEAITNDSATISWGANVSGFGSVIYGTTALDQGPVGDTINWTQHSITLVGLSPGTRYRYRASNVDPVGGDPLASVDGELTTTDALFQLTRPHAEPRTIQVGQTSTISIVVQDQGIAVPGVDVSFAIDAAASSGSGTLSSEQATSDANGVARLQLTGTERGHVKVIVTLASAENSPMRIPVVIR